MFHQTFSLLDIFRVVTLIFLECVLSADNALIMASIIHPLPIDKQKKALWIGISSAIVLRIFAILGIAYLIQFFWIKILGAAYLLYLAISYRMQRYFNKTFAPLKTYKLWKIVVQLEAVDLIFAFDSIIAGLGFMGIALTPQGGMPPKLWIVYVGGLCGLILMRFAAQGFSRLMRRFPNLETASHYLIGWVAIKLGAITLYAYFKPFSSLLSFWVEIVFWSGIIILFCYGVFFKNNKANH